MTEHVLRTDLDGAATAGVEPGRPAGHHLQRLHRRAGGRQHGEGVALGVEGIDRLCRTRPMAADAVRARQCPAQTGGGGELILRPVAGKHLSNLEQRHVGIAAVGVPLRRHDQTGNETRPHVGEFGRDRVGQRQGRAAAAERFGLALSHERPGNGFG